MHDFAYAVEPTGADSPSQNGGAEIYNNTLTVKVQTLLYGAGLPAKFWSAALLHAVYLHNRLVHLATNKTPYEGWTGGKPDISHLKTFGSRVCVKCTGMRQCKLDHHDFTGIFLGYTATDQNITYLDLNSGIVKSCHHAVFDKAWYHQPTCPPVAQLLYDLGLEADTEFMTFLGPLQPTPPETGTPITVPWPPPQPKLLKKASLWAPPSPCLYAPKPLRITNAPPPVCARAARVQSRVDNHSKWETAADVVAEYLIGATNMAMIYVSPDPYAAAFEKNLISIKWTLIDIRPLAYASLKRMVAFFWHL